MILQKLVEYYDRKSNDPDMALAPEGFESKEIPFLIVLDRDGNYKSLMDTRRQEGKKLRAAVFEVPQTINKTANIAANLLWDNTAYVLGIGSDTNPRVIEQHGAFITRLDELPAIPEVFAIRAFLASNPAERFREDPAWADVFDKKLNISFAVMDESGKPQPVFSLPAVRQALSVPEGGESPGEEGEKKAVCLVTGEKADIAILHPAIKGVWGTPTTGGKIISFNFPATESYEKRKAQGLNAPVSKRAAFAYITALNFLLGRDSGQRLQLGDASTVFWAEKPCRLEKDFLFLFEPDRDNPDRNAEAVKNLYASVEKGRLNVSDLETRFFVLGLGPNAARIAIRFWMSGTVREISERIVQYFDDIEIDHAPYETGYLPLSRTLYSLVFHQGKGRLSESEEKYLGNLTGDTMRSILCGLPYPVTLLQAAIRRIRATQEVTYERAAIIKACINRKTYPKNADKKEEITVSLDNNNTNPGYLLGRLFAALERIQAEANPDIKATIRDRFYGAASSTPVTVFPSLIKLSNHHLTKIGSINEGRQVNLLRLVREIVGGLDGHEANFPRVLSLEDQGRFAIGYYHQSQAFFSGKQKETSTETSSAGENV